MDSSILKSVRSACNLSEGNTDFDIQLIPLINTELMILNQMGIGPEEVFKIEGETETWNDFLEEDYNSMQSVITLVGYKVKSLFDPASSSVLSTAIDSIIKELEWRIHSEYNYHKSK